MDVIVKLLLRLEEEEAGVQMWHPKVEGVPEAVVKEHLFLMRDAGWWTSGNGTQSGRWSCRLSFREFSTKAMTFLRRCGRRLDVAGWRDGPRK